MLRAFASIAGLAVFSLACGGTDNDASDAAPIGPDAVVGGEDAGADAGILPDAAPCTPSDGGPPAVDIVPADNAILNRVHVLLRWTPVECADGYEVVVVVDTGASDPFDGATVAVAVAVVGDLAETVITDGLAYDTAYAWRARAIDGDPEDFSETYRFVTAPLPRGIPTMTSSVTGAGQVEPGVTLFDSRTSSGGGLALAVDVEGTLIWFYESPTGLGDVRLLPSGRLLAAAGGRVREFTLDGEVTWESPEGLSVHHEVSPMPNGNILTLVREVRDIVGPGGEIVTYEGDRVVEFDRETKDIVFEVSDFEVHSTEDYDEQAGMQRWTHNNAVVYNPDDNSIYVSSRHLSRITRIDRATGDVVYKMGFEMPSGDADFGDNLFSFQHAPQLLANGHMVLFDNGNRRDHMVQTEATGMTRAIELAFTGTPPTSATIVWQWMVPVYSPSRGDADRLPGGNTLVTASGSGMLYEVALTGDIVWSLQFSAGFPYRAERVLSLFER